MGFNNPGILVKQLPNTPRHFQRQKEVRLMVLNCCCQLMWQYSGVPEDPEDNPVTEKHSVDTPDSMVKSILHAIDIEKNQAQDDPGHQTLQIAKP
jgi:hypothetical protein